MTAIPDNSAEATGAVATASQANTGLVINVVYDASAASAPAAFKTVIAQVVQFFESTFRDPVTVNIDVGYGEVDNQSLGSGALGESLTYLQHYSYTQLRSAFLADAKSAADTSAVAALPASDPANGGNYWVSRAEAKALGLAAGSSAVDGFAGFSSTSAFDFDDSDGVTAGQYDFFGVVAHEFSEIMGRMLNVGQTFGGLANGYFAYDLFHYSAPGVRDFVGTRPGYFSVDGGGTRLADFNTIAGGDFGDWAGSAGNDSFRAFSNSGVANRITAADVAAMDAIGWDLNAAPVVNHPPVVASFSPTVHIGQIAAASLFQASDPDGNAITQWDLWDPVVGNGNFAVNGVAQTARQEVLVSSLAGLGWDAAGETAPTVVSVRAYDGALWSDWTTININFALRPPTVAGLGPAIHGASVAATSLFQTSDADGRGIVQWDLWDPVVGNGGFAINGVAQAARQELDVSSLTGLSWDPTDESTPTVIAVRAFDGSLWSDWASVSINFVERAPTIAALGAAVHSAPVAAASLFQASDLDGDAITQWELWDPLAGSGNVAIGGAAQAARQELDMSSLAGVSWDPTGESGPTPISVRAFDGTLWSDWTTININFVERAPTVTGLNLVVNGGQVTAGSLFQASDPDGDAIAQWDLWDPLAGSGNFVINGVAQSSRQELFVSSLTGVDWDATSETGPTVIGVRAFDGSLWSDWTSLTINHAGASLAAVQSSRMQPAVGTDAATTSLIQALAGVTPSGAAALATPSSPPPADQQAPVLAAPPHP